MPGIEHVGYERTLTEELERLPDVTDAQLTLGSEVVAGIVHSPYAQFEHPENPSIILGDR